MLWIFSSLVGTLTQSGALVIIEISLGSKLETEVFKIVIVTPLLFGLQKECLEKCGIKPTMLRKLADEVNDPSRHHHHHLPEVVRSACFITVIWYIYSFTPNYSLKKGHAHVKRLKMLVILRWGVYRWFWSRLGCAGKKCCHYFSCKVINSQASNSSSFLVS